MIHDDESKWSVIPSNSTTKLLFSHDDLEGFYRVVDSEKQKIRFSDVKRIFEIHDINKILTGEENQEELFKAYLGIINDALDDVEPITFPYERTGYIAYIEAFPGFSENTDDCLGILYFKGLAKDEMIPVKKFFRIMPIISLCKYEEIDFKAYNDAKNKWYRRARKNVGNNSDKRSN